MESAIKLAIHTLFLPRESVLYMEEWLLYHATIGIDHFYLYDNTGSNGDYTSAYRVPFRGTRTKYGLPLISKKITDQELQEAVCEICSKFSVTLIPWPSEFYTQKQQLDSVAHFCKNFDADFVACIDMDEYIYSEPYFNIKNFLQNELILKGYCGVKVSQSKFAHILKAKIKEDVRFYDLVDTFEMETRNWAPKSIVDPKKIKIGNNIHQLDCKEKMLDQPNRNLIRINHYNCNEYQFHWLSKNYHQFDCKVKKEDLYLGQSKDSSMVRYKEKLEKWNFTNTDHLKLWAQNN